jgi:hypothetical protein
MHRKTIGVAVVVTVLLATAGLYKALWHNHYRVEDILAACQEGASYGVIAVEQPLDGTLFPPEIVPPRFFWEDSSGARAWLVRIEFADGGLVVQAVTRRPRWTPAARDWDSIKRRSLEQPARVLVLGVGPGRPVQVLSRARLSFRTSKDPVGAPLFYRDVVLPFAEADKNPGRIRWRFGTIDSPQPPIVLQNVPVCANCHSFTADGGTLAMDFDYANNKGAYIITPVQKEMVLTPGDIISWNDYERSGQTSGVLSQISPDGRYVVSTVKDLAVFITRPPRAFSQLFFPVKGILCVYDRQARTFRALPGADDPNLVQSNPAWSPDGRYLVFARARVPDLSLTHAMGRHALTADDGRLLVRDGKPFRFDLYRIPFNDGAGGTPEPLAGASHNGTSNYFARYSPDGRWIIFCRARSYMLLQPDSELYIIPAEGGTPCRLRCNTARMNSWHSWSPNGKWLVFSSKGYSDYTQLCLTHIDENGESSPPVLLSHLTAPDRAANIPEFVNTTPGAIAHIRDQFLRSR